MSWMYGGEGVGLHGKNGGSQMEMDRKRRDRKDMDTGGGIGIGRWDSLI